MSLAPYIDKMANRFGLADAAAADVPIDPGFLLNTSDINEVTTPEMISEYHSLIGSLGFAATRVCFDMAYAVSFLSRHHAKNGFLVVLIGDGLYQETMLVESTMEYSTHITQAKF